MTLLDQLWQLQAAVASAETSTVAASTEVASRNSALLEARAILDSRQSALTEAQHILDEHTDGLAAIKKKLADFRSAPVKGGPDVAQYQGSVDWTKVAAAGYDFAFVKATEGVNFVDPWFNAARIKAIRDVDLVPGYYHFARPQPNRTGTQEANFALGTIKGAGGLAPGDLPLVLDIETAKDRTPSQIRQFCDDFCARTKEVTGKGCIVYTGFFWNDIVKLTHPVNGAVLWNAHYTTAASPRPITGFSGWRFWQYTDQGIVPGINVKCDLSRFNGNRGQLADLLLR